MDAPIPDPAPWEQLMQALGGQGRSTPFEVISRHHPPTFEGRGDPVVLEDWIGHFEKMFRVTKCPDEDKVEIATYYLSGSAQRWWETLRVSRTADPNFKGRNS